MDQPSPPTRIQRKNRGAILEAALQVFAARGFGGATVDQIAAEAGLSKPNLLYYFPSKEAIYAALVERQLDTWLDPLRALDAGGEPVEEILDYVRRKLEMARDYPRESRLFANEILQGAPQLGDTLAGPLKALVDEKCVVIREWSDAGRIARVDPHHLIFSIWATTQHYADFEVQVQAVLGPRSEDWVADAEAHLDRMFRATLRVGE